MLPAMGVAVVVSGGVGRFPFWRSGALFSGVFAGDGGVRIVHVRFCSGGCVKRDGGVACVVGDCCDGGDGEEGAMVAIDVGSCGGLLFFQLQRVTADQC